MCKSFQTSLLEMDLELCIHNLVMTYFKNKTVILDATHEISIFGVSLEAA